MDASTCCVGATASGMYTCGVSAVQRGSGKGYKLYYKKTPTSNTNNQFRAVLVESSI